MQWIKRYLVWIMLALTVLASIWVQQQEDTAEEALVVMTPPRKPVASVHETSQDLVITANQHAPAVITRIEITDIPENIFAPYISPNEVMVDEVDALPQAPPTPYIYAGKLIEDGKLTVFLTDGTQNHTVQMGDVINANWRIQSINPPELMLEYIPLGVTTKMQIGAVK